MKKILFIAFFCVAFAYVVYGQMPSEKISQLKEQLFNARSDTARLNLEIQLAFGYRFADVDSSLYYAETALNLAKKTKSLKAEATILSLKGGVFLEIGNLPESMKLQFESLNMIDKLNDIDSKADILNKIGNIYMELADYKKANEYYFLSMEMGRKMGNIRRYYNEISNIGNVYELSNMADSALYYQQMVYNESLKTKDRNFITWAEMLFRMGNAYKLKGEKVRALIYYKRGIAEAFINNDIRNLTMNNLYIAKLYAEMNKPDSSFLYVYKTLETGKIASFRKGIYEACLLLAGLYRANNKPDSAYKYLVKANNERDYLFGANRIQELQRIILEQKEIQYKNQQEAEQQNRLLKTIMFSIALLLSFLLALYFWLNNRKQKKVNTILKEQRLKISSQNVELVKTLTDLKSTQAQLIQSEKLASLGELTAGIAHEIQNPLNFVNNFSELSVDLVKDLKDEMGKPDVDKEYVGELFDDLSQNQEKINHHGKRASSIVKGMLEHSRARTGVKELTDINKLADEYLRLSYHGLRAKDDSFNVDYEFIVDDNLPKIEVIPQDIGRVLLNLINNAFYAVNEKMKQNTEGVLYKSTVTVSTQNIDNQIIIKVKDNGTGMPESVKAKVFQPFFTTKPTGQGTGLGLSLAYDIVTKGHGGTLEVLSTEGVGSEFTITLPFKTNGL